MDKNNRREGIEFDKYLSILTNDCTYEQNYELWDSI